MTRILRWVLICALVFGILPVGRVNAAHGVPGSPEFGYGAWLHTDGPYFDQGLSLLQDLALDWVAIDVDWSALQTAPSAAIDNSRLDRAFAAASRGGTAVLISLTNPPDWAMSTIGPDAKTAADLILALSARYGESLCAVELFPGGNTFAGWRANPDPVRYAALFTYVQQNLNAAGSSIHLIAGGLRPLASGSNPVDWNDLDFLRGLYAAGAKDWMPILSIQLPSLSGKPLQINQDSTPSLRHYEAVRQVMLENGHTTGRLWVTLINAPDGTISASDSIYADQQHQTEWLQQALIQVRSQLYIGAAIFHNLNPASNDTALYRSDALVLDKTTVHPFYAVFKAIIRQTNPDPVTARPGRPKGNTLLKSKYKT